MSVKSIEKVRREYLLDQLIIKFVGFESNYSFESAKYFFSNVFSQFFKTIKIHEIYRSIKTHRNLSLIVLIADDKFQ